MDKKDIREHYSRSVIREMWIKGGVYMQVITLDGDAQKDLLKRLQPEDIEAAVAVCEVTWKRAALEVTFRRKVGANPRIAMDNHSLSCELFFQSIQEVGDAIVSAIEETDSTVDKVDLQWLLSDLDNFRERYLAKFYQGYEKTGRLTLIESPEFPAKSSTR